MGFNQGTNSGDIPVLSSAVSASTVSSNTAPSSKHTTKRSGLSLDELEKTEVPFTSTSFNHCSRKGKERRQIEERRGRIRLDCTDRRNGRDRRLLTYF